MFKFMQILLLLFVCLSSKAGTISENVDDKKYLEYASQFECVVSIDGSYQDGKIFSASAVAIRPKWLLTAAHVVENCKEAKITHKDKKIKILKITPHKDFSSNKFGYYDICLIKIEEDLKMKFYPSLYKEKDEIGKVVSICGFGLTGTFRTGCRFGDNKKRAGSNIIDYSEKTILVCSPSQINSKTNTSLEFLICSGDSGGGLFLDGKLAGINSGVVAIDKNPNSSYGDESCHTRISIMIDWIEENIID